jgi:hypothetical protein
LAVSEGPEIGERTVNFDAPAVKISEATTGYTITATPTSGTPIIKTTTVAGATTVSGLNANETYTLTVVTNNEYGSSSLVSSSEQFIPLKIGSFYAGGVVFYLDPADNTHGLVVATEDQSSGINWSNGLAAVITNATGTAIGTGASNTTQIISVQGAPESSYAAGLARAYRGGEYTDWFLPSKDELNELYINKDVLNSVTGFTKMDKIYHWSSSEINRSVAWKQYVENGNQYDGSNSFKNVVNDNGVRAVRAF